MNPPALNLHDIHAPPPPEFWPPAPGWWIAALLLLALAALLTTRLYRYYRRLQRKRMILAELERLEHNPEKRSAAERVTGISMLLRRVALAKYNRRRVAPLTGRDWLQFLDSTGGAGRFSQGAGRVLETGPYQPKVEETEISGLLALARDWLKINTGKTHEH